MAGRGPAPKDPSKLHPRSKRSPMPTTTVSPDGAVRGPELPDDRNWPARTQAWWETWRNSPQSQAFTASDWDFLLDTAVLHAAFWSGNNTVAAELRLRVAKFGATPEDRLRLRMQIDEPEQPKPEAAQRGGRYGHLRSVKPA